jgi:hypothetical protein
MNCAPLVVVAAMLAVGPAMPRAHPGHGDPILLAGAVTAIES